MSNIQSFTKIIFDFMTENKCTETTMKLPVLVMIVFALIGTSFRKTTENITYNTHVKPIIAKYCLGCHSEENEHNYYMKAGVLSQYDSVKNMGLNGKLRERVLIKKDMPMAPAWSPAQRLTETELVVLDSWISQGCQLD